MALSETMIIAVLITICVIIFTTIFAGGFNYPPMRESRELFFIKYKTISYTYFAVVMAILMNKIQENLLEIQQEIREIKYIQKNSSPLVKIEKEWIIRCPDCGQEPEHNEDCTQVE